MGDGGDVMNCLRGLLLEEVADWGEAKYCFSRIVVLIFEEKVDWGEVKYCLRIVFNGVFYRRVS